MKKIVILLVLFWSLSAFAVSNKKGYFKLSTGMAWNLWSQGEAFSDSNMEKMMTQDLVLRIGLGYGTQIGSDYDYLGTLGIGIGNYEMSTTIFNLTYGYEFMRDSDFSLGVEIAGLIGAKGLRTEDLIIGSEAGVFGKLAITQSIAGLIRISGGVLTNITGNMYLRLYPAFDASIRWYL